MRLLKRGSAFAQTNKNKQSNTRKNKQANTTNKQALAVRFIMGRFHFFREQVLRRPRPLNKNGYILTGCAAGHTRQTHTPPRPTAKPCGERTPSRVNRPAEPKHKIKTPSWVAGINCLTNGCSGRTTLPYSGPKLSTCYTLIFNINGPYFSVNGGM